MRTPIAPAPLFALVVAACSTGDLASPRATAPSASAARGAAATMPSRPISGRCALHTLATDPFPAPPVFRQVATGTCELAHVGHATVSFVQVVNFATQTQHSLELTYTAPNGDVLRAASDGTNVPSASGVSFSATIDFAGGTGRFSGATGQARANGTADIAAGTSEYTLEGWVAFDASHR